MTNQLSILKKETVDVVASRVREFQEAGEINFPSGYSPENAMKSAWLILQDTKDKNGAPAITACSKNSIANALLDMVVQGLNPVKKQGYFIPYGKSLTFQRSYFGTMAVTKRVTNAKSIDAAIIYDGDDVDYEMSRGRVTNLTHKQKFGNQDEKIVGAYCTIIQEDDSEYIELMTIAEIEKSWGQSKMNPNSATSTHKKFPQEMAKRTVINRACKKFLNSSDDSSIIAQTFNKQDHTIAEAQASDEIESNANTEYIDIEPKEIDVDEETGEIKEESKTTPEPEQDYSDVDQVMNDMDKEEQTTSGPDF